MIRAAQPIIRADLRENPRSPLNSDVGRHNPFRVSAVNFEAETEATPLTPELEAELFALAASRAPSDLAAVAAAEDDQALFYAAPKGAMAAYLLGNLVQARQLASQCLALAEQFPDNWNYGNAIHLAHTVAGLLALGEGNTKIASSELLKSGSTPGSPQLGSFGPSMFLALRLIQAGESATVLHYFQLCRNFWKMGGVWLDLWEAKVRAGGTPNFFSARFR